MRRITHAYELNAPWKAMAPSARLTRKVRSRLLAQYLMIMQSCCARKSFCTYLLRLRVRVRVGVRVRVRVGVRVRIGVGVRVRVLLHVRVEEARLAHGELIAYGDVALQLGGSVLELQNRHARAVDRLDLR